MLSTTGFHSNTWRNMLRAAKLIIKARYAQSLALCKQWQNLCFAKKNWALWTWQNTTTHFFSLSTVFCENKFHPISFATYEKSPLCSYKNYYIGQNVVYNAQQKTLGKIISYEQALHTICVSHQFHCLIDFLLTYANSM